MDDWMSFMMEHGEWFVMTTLVQKKHKLLVVNWAFSVPILAEYTNLLTEKHPCRR